MKRVLELDAELMAYIAEIGKQAEGENGKLIRAYTLQIHVKHMVMREINTALLKPDLNNFAGFRSNLQQDINFALTAFNYFNEEGISHEAYLALCNGLEFLEIGKFKLGKVLYQDIESLYDLKKELEDDMLLEPYDMQVSAIFERAGLKPAVEGEIVEDFTHEQNAALKTLIDRRLNLPVEQMGNLANEINGYQEVFRRCPPDKIWVRSIYYPVAHIPSYHHPVRFVLVMKSTGIESSPSWDIPVLLNDWGYLKAE